jgi:hypothetical protein
MCQILGSSESGRELRLSLDHDRAEHTPVRLAPEEQRPDPVVLEAAEPEADPLMGLIRASIKTSVEDFNQE